MATNAVARSTRRVYSAEELHRLRNTQSQPKLSEAIEEHGSEDAELVKEHVLKTSKSFAARSYKGRQSTSGSLRVPSNTSHNENSSVSSHDAFLPPAPNAPQPPQVLSENLPNGQVVLFRPGRSPTPSLKRAAVEALKQNHGSPNHVRVTAGGRIVTAEQSPLCQPRYGYSAIKINGSLIKFAPNQRFSNRPGETEPATDQQGQIVEDEYGNHFQIVGNKILPLHVRADGFMELHMAAGNLTVPRSHMPPVRATGPGAGPIVNNSAVVPEPSIDVQLKALKAQHQRYADEQKHLDQEEAVHSRTWSARDRNSLVSRRRYLVNESDKIRRQIKAIESRPPQEAPTSPRAMQGRHSMSITGIGRGNLQPMLQGPPMSGGAPHQYGPILNGPPTSFTSQFGATPSPDEGFNNGNGNGWVLPPAGMFMPPPPFDGAMAAPLPMMQSAPFNGALASTHAAIPQCDGARSLSGHRLESPDRSRAVSIKAPDGKPGLKSGLNPMSPAYKPSMVAGKDTSAPVAHRRVATPLSPMHKLSAPVTNAVDSSSATDETVMPTKRDDLVQSSSVTSFRTADFFPGNPREHSARQHAYAHSYDKENDEAEGDADSITPVRDTFKSSAPDTGDHNAPAAPPGTPIYYSAPTTHAPQPAKAEVNNTQQAAIDVADRQAHNISPKNRRGFVFINEDPSQAANSTSSSPPEDTSSQQAESFGSLQDKSANWLHGWTAGLQRQNPYLTVPGFPTSCDPDVLVGYCTGINTSAPLKAAPTAAQDLPAVNAASLTALSNTGTRSPMKALSRRPSPAMASRSSSRLRAVENASNMARPPFECSTKSIDCLKQAIFAPQNENAVLTPAANGLHVSEANFNLGGWAKKPHNAPTMELPGLGYPIPQRNTTVGRQDVMSEGGNDVRAKLALDRTSEHQQPARPALQSNLSTASIASGSIGTGGGVPTPSNRITSIDSSMLGQWPANRVKTPSEWRSTGAQQSTGLTTGFFAHTQFDGTDDASALTCSATQLTTGVPGAPQRVTSDTHARLSSGGRFREGSIDRITSPPTSPRPMSPVNSPFGTPVRRDSRKNSPRKGPSPTKVIGSLAEKVGIKVTSPTPSEMGEEQTSPSGKRHWGGVRDWMKSGKGNNV